MPIDAVHNAPLNEYRCGMRDCNAILFKGTVKAANVEVKCKCGTLNLINIQPEAALANPGNGNNGLAYQDRLNLHRKGNKKKAR